MKYFPLTLAFLLLGCEVKYEAVRRFEPDPLPYCAVVDAKTGCVLWGAMVDCEGHREECLEAINDVSWRPESPVRSLVAGRNIQDFEGSANRDCWCYPNAAEIETVDINTKLHEEIPEP